MAKISTHPLETVLSISEKWKLECLIADGSLFSANKLWTFENLEQFEKYFTNNLIEGSEETFYQKLKIQLSNASAEVKQLSAEMIFILLLFQSNITARRKAEDIKLIWGWSGTPFGDSLPSLEEILAEGVGSTGMAYNNRRSDELVFFAAWLMRFKRLAIAEREQLISDPWVFANWLDKNEGADRRQFRHIVLFLLFPEHFETSSSRNQKNQMLDAFKNKLDGESQLIGMNDSEWVKKDKNILAIREKLTQEAGKPINFYLSPYKEMWMSKNGGVDDVENELEDSLNSSKDFKDLSEQFLSLQEKAKQLGLKNIDQEIPFEFQEKIKEAGKDTHEIEIEKFCSKLIIKATKNQLIIPNIAFYMALEALPIYKAIKEFNDVFIAIYERLKSAGKITSSKAETFYQDFNKPENAGSLKKIFDDAVGGYLKEIGKDSQINVDRFNKFIYQKSWKSAGNGDGKSPGRSDIWNSPVLTAFGTSHSNQGFICELVDILGRANGEFSKYSLLNGRHDPATVVGPKNLIVYGAPGTGKSYYINNLLKNANTIRTVFHSETQNSDFVGSLKPITNADGKVTYDFVAGPFIKAFIAAVKNPEKQIHLVIEEINRANAAAVFGEVFQLLDRDSSGKSEYSIQADELLTKYLQKNLDADFDGLIYIPPNLTINATMNSSDQGVYPLDSAFKRRWSFKYMPIDFQSSPKGAVKLDDRFLTWDNLAKSINEVLSAEYAHLEEDRFIGPWFLNREEVHSQFSRAIEAKLFTYLWNDVLRHQPKDKIFNGQNINTFSDLIKVFNRQNAGEHVNIFSDLVHLRFDKNIEASTPSGDESSSDESDE